MYKNFEKTAQGKAGAVFFVIRQQFVFLVKNKGFDNFLQSLVSGGRRAGIRTLDPLIKSQLL